MRSSPPDPHRRLTGFRGRDRWLRQRLVGAVGVSLLFIAGVLACWYLSARTRWWVVSIGGTLIGLMSVVGETMALRFHRQKMREVEGEIENVA